MKYIQILNGVMCSSDIDSCCSDYGIAKYIYVMKQAINIIHFVVPIILIIMSGIQLFKMVTSPDDPQGKKMKSLRNKFIATIIIFFMPFIVNLAVEIIPDSFSVSGCWQSADDVVTLMNELEEINYDPFESQRKPIGDDYEGLKDEHVYDGSQNNSQDSNYQENGSTGLPIDSDDNAPKEVKKARKKVVKYAETFLGYPYKYGGCDLTSGIDCSCFVQKIYEKNGYNLKRTAEEQASDSNYQDIALTNIQPGDLLYYYDSNGKIGHVTMYIGNMKVIHASNPKDGIKISGYTYRKPTKAKRIIAT